MKYYIIAGEASGDLHGSNLIHALRTKDPKAEIRCWGGELMKNAGATLVKDYKELAFMGFWEVLINLKTILKNLRLCREDIDNFKIFKNLNKGELTVIISDKPINSKEFNENDIIIKAKKFFKNYSLKDTVNLISVSEKINKKTIYEICLKIKNEKTS